MLGPDLAELAQKGKAWAFALLGRKYRRSELPTSAKWSLGPRHIAALSWVVTAHLVFRTKGLIVSHYTMGGLLVGLGRGGKCLGERWTGQTMRELARWGLIHSQPWVSDGDAPLRLSNLYTVSDFAVRFFDLGRFCQAGPLRGKDPGKESGDRTAVVTVPDAAPDGLEAAGRVKDRPEAQPGSGRGGLANPPLVRTRSALVNRIEELARRRLREVEAQARQLAASAVELGRREAIARGEAPPDPDVDAYGRTPAEVAESQARLDRELAKRRRPS